MLLNDDTGWDLQKESITSGRRRGFSVPILGFFLFRDGLLPSFLSEVAALLCKCTVWSPLRLLNSDLSFNTLSGNAGGSPEKPKRLSIAAHNSSTQIFNSCETSEGLK
jgi:hypothetical protein